ncbi:MAG TPA: hypothetical protein VHK01_19330, partial [Lacipirellulaceae bacterium]|nr:hypothetical protein [Lacipirellulaceae bacterium]
MLRGVSWRALCALFVLSIPLTVEAATKVWSAAVSGDFGAAANWTGGVPGAADAARFSVAGTYGVVFDNTPNPLFNPVLNQDLFFLGGTVTFTSGADGTYTYRLTGTGGDDAQILGGALTLGLSGLPLHMIVDDDLLVRGGATLNVNSGSHVDTLDLVLAATPAGGNGTVFVDGVGSQLNVTSGSGFSAGTEGTATLTYRNSATGSLTNVTLANSSSAANTATLNVESGATLTSGNLSVGIGTAAATGNLNIHGTNSAVTQAPASSVTVGTAAAGIGTINIGTTASGATFTSGTGTMTINARGTVNIGSGANTGTLNANGDVTIDGGVLTRGDGSTFALAPGKTMTISNGGSATFNNSFDTSLNANYNITGSGSELRTLALGIRINNGAQVNVTNQGLLEASSGILIGTAGNGTLSVDGTGTAVSASAVSIWGTNGNVATVTFSNGASGAFTTLLLANNLAGTTASVNILSGASLNLSSSLQLGGPGTTTATLDIQGSGSSVMQSGSGNVVVGFEFAGAGTATNTINIGTTASGAVFTTGTGFFRINATGTVNIGSGANTGTLNLNGNTTVNGGSITRTTGILSLAAGRTFTAQSDAQINLGFDGLLTGGNTWNFNSGADLTSTGPLDIGVSDGTTIVTVDGIGSSMTTGSATSRWGRLGHTAIVTIRNNATADIGDLDIARSGGTGGTSGTLNVQSGAQVTVGNLRVADLEFAPGITFFGTVNVMGIGSTLTLSPASVLRLGQDLASTGAATLNVTDGGTVTVGSSTTLDNTGTINIDGGIVDLKTLIEMGGTINFIAGSLSYLGNLTVGT